GIGAGAHGKLTLGAEQRSLRRWKLKHPTAWLAAAGTAAAIGGDEDIAPPQRPFEFMLNALRLVDGFSLSAFEARCGLPASAIDGPLAEASARGWLRREGDRVVPPAPGRRFGNGAIGLSLAAGAGLPRHWPRRARRVTMGRPVPPARLMPASHSPVEPATPRSLAAAGLPPRVRKALEAALSMVTADIESHLGAMLNEFEEELFRLADQARSPGSESGYMQPLRTFRLNRADLVPRFIIELEALVATIRTPPTTTTAAVAGEYGQPPQPGFGKLSLVDEAVMDEDTVLREIASRQEARANLALHLLSQRFGVLAAAPAFDTERLPLGPQAL